MLLITVFEDLVMIGVILSVLVCGGFTVGLIVMVIISINSYIKKLRMKLWRR